MGNVTGGGAQADLYQTENNLEINDTVSWTRGRHYVQFGVNIPNLSRRVWEDSTNRLGTVQLCESFGIHERNTLLLHTADGGGARCLLDE